MPPKRQTPRPPANPPPEQAGEAADAKPVPESPQTSAGAEQADSGGGASLNDTILVPSNSATPASSRPGTPSTSTQTPSVPSSRGSTRGRGRGRAAAVVATPKFTGRRSATARAEAEKIENERKKVEVEARAKEDAARARREGRGRGAFGGRGGGRGEMHRGRGRGGFMGERRAGGEVASGPFSAGQANKREEGKRRALGGDVLGGGGGFGIGGGGGAGSGGGGGGGSSSSGAARTSASTGVVKQEPGMLGATGHGDGNVTIIPRVKTEDGGIYISSDEEDEGVHKGLGRMNVEDLGFIDLTQDDDDAPPDPTRVFQPVRLKREAHVDRALGLNADGATTQEGVASTEVGGGGSGEAPSAPGKGKGRQRAKDVEVTGASEPFQATYSSSDEQDLPPIKVESIDDDGPQPVMAPPRTSSPQPVESRRKGKERERAVKPRTLSGSAAEMPVHQTQDEVAEWERRQKDLELIFGELGTQAPPRQDRDGDANMEEESVNAKREAKTYLFQFPPVLPDLTPIIVKPDPDAPPAPTDGGDAMDLDDIGPANTVANPITVSDPPAGTGNTPRTPKLPSGAVGKLRIHKSGKATLDWGGTKMSLGMGTEASFLQDVVIMSLPEKKAAVRRESGDDGGGGGGGAGIGGSSSGGGEEDAAPGWAMGMGQVKGKFVVVPDWEDLLG
ncbi:hypothetical protein B0A55_10861 [Friedmanniomyces simplex]|uniref:Uncharacterized protein n=1 Tax=Friedmanniomyces simplex TaxID=329884 RepID=A0A4U0WVA0_9PEZI|nr:hypothetical protein B0A55_10861 [Friedmanniomyces simplex]